MDAECFPDARFLLVVRDPVANVEGFRRKWPTFGRAPLSDSIGFYRRTHERFLELASSRRHGSQQVRREALGRALLELQGHQLPREREPILALRRPRGGLEQAAGLIRG